MKRTPITSRLLHPGVLVFLAITFLLFANGAHAKTQRSLRNEMGLATFASLRETNQQPEFVPDASRGLQLYTQRCANCHGPEGGGDGSLAVDLPNPPTPFSAVDFRHTAVPLELFDAITNGRPALGMPPFGPGSSNPIDDAGRWDLVAAIYTLSTPAETITAGEAVYEANCLACHGAGGAGDGPEAAALEVAPTDLSSLDYWAGRSNAAVFNLLTAGTIPQHNYTLSDEEQRAVVDYARTFSYAYVDPQALRAPIPNATIRGQVVNGTSSQPVTGGEVLLRAFTPELEAVFSETVMVDGDGRYATELSDVPPDWIFLATTLHEGVSFSSGANQLSREQPVLEMAIIVYDPTSDAGDIVIEQLHLALEFVEDRLLVNELYRFGNMGTAVYVGPSGNPAAGTVEMVLPAGADNINFQRSLGSLESFLPAEEVVQTERGWADTVPVRPGRGTLNLLVQYELPYRPGETIIAHPLQYPVSETSAAVPDSGVALAGERWLLLGSEGAGEQGSGGSFLSYTGAGLEAGEAVNLLLEGRPRLVYDAEGNLILSRNQSLELILGGLALLVAVAGAWVAIRAWQRPAAVHTASLEGTAEIDRLLQAAAELDDAYESGKLDGEQYQRERTAVKEKLLALWPRADQ